MEISKFINELQSSINFYGIIFYALALLIVVSGLVTILANKLMHSAVALLFCFFGVAGIYAMLAADFIAVTQIMVYIGGILTLIIFGVMLTTRMTEANERTAVLDSTKTAIGALISACSGIGLVLVFLLGDWKQVPLEELPESTLQDIGNLLFTNYIAAFIAAAILLLVAFIEAALIARRKN
ncbi:MAG: NADH-quinone oxidoreductase subunit J [Candidatus Kapaibacterium sp.]|jgi:NADH-quinone oxidoreductase subunit J